MNFSLKKKLLITLLGVAAFAGAYAQNSFFAKSIKVIGLERISKETVLKILGIHMGERGGATETNEAVKSLYGSGFFKNVKLYQDGNALIIQVAERPLISSVDFYGNDKIKNEDMKKVLREAALDVGNLANPEILFQVKQSLLMQYALMGYYSTTVNIEEIKQISNRVAIKINITEGKIATVRRINLIGNTAYSQSDLIDTITFKTPSLWNLWGFLNSKTNYSPTNMQSSVEDLSNYYMNNGYLDFKVTSQQASLSANKENTFIAFDGREGEVYKVSKVVLQGKFVISKLDLEKLVSFKVGDTFSRQKVLDSAKAITQALGDEGYAFANVNPAPAADTDNKTVALTFYFDPGKKVYINQVNFLGNNVTNDYVYRRQMQYFESGAYNQSMIDQLKIKLQNMSFVDYVTVYKVRLPASDDLVNIDYNIKERSANRISASIGYSQLYSFMIGGNLALPNVQGTGNQFLIGANLSSVYQNLNMSYTNPYFTQSGITQTVSTYLSRRDNDDTSIASYHLNQYGANLGYSIPTSAFDSISFGGGVDHTEVLQPTDGSSSILDWFFTHHDNGNQNSFNTFTVNLGWNHDSTNRTLFPIEGKTLGLNATVLVPGISDLQWFKVTGLAGFFYPIIDSVTLVVKGGVDYGNGYGKTQSLPFFQNFYGGGWGSVRGFSQGHMGASDTHKTTGGTGEQGNSIGGNLNVYTNIDILFPVPGLKHTRNMRLGMFCDAGNVYYTYSIPTHLNGGPLWKIPVSQTSPNFSNLRYSVGVEFQWLSPLGAMAFSVAKPLNTSPGDSTQVFQFTLGQTF